jgi:calcium/calmodulin-dependent protein kinase I
VALKETAPNALDLRNGRRIETYDDLEMHCQEIKTLLRLKESTSTPNNSKVLFLYEYFMLGSNLQVVTERLGEELEEWRQKCESFSEKMAMDICRTILKAISFMESKGVVHRDIKMQNILFRKNGDFRSLKIVDFGLACVLEEKETSQDLCGSIGYIAPEIYLRKSYRYEVDMFAFGVLLFKLLSGERPFASNNERILHRRTVHLRYNVHGKVWKNVSVSAKDMVRRLLINRHERLTAEQALEHQWFSEEGRSILRFDVSQLGQADSRSKAFARVSSLLEVVDRCQVRIASHNRCPRRFIIALLGSGLCSYLN